MAANAAAPRPAHYQARRAARRETRETDQASGLTGSGFDVGLVLAGGAAGLLVGGPLGLALAFGAGLLVGSRPGQRSSGSRPAGRGAEPSASAPETEPAASPATSPTSSRSGPSRRARAVGTAVSPPEPAEPPQEMRQTSEKPARSRKGTRRSSARAPEPVAASGHGADLAGAEDAAARLPDTDQTELDPDTVDRALGRTD